MPVLHTDLTKYLWASAFTRRKHLLKKWEMFDLISGFKKYENRQSFLAVKLTRFYTISRGAMDIVYSLTLRRQGKHADQETNTCLL